MKRCLQIILLTTAELLYLKIILLKVEGSSFAINIIKFISLILNSFYFQVLFLAALVAAVAAQYGHGHGHGFSSQHIYRHDGPAHVVPVHGGHGHGYDHGHAVDYYVSSSEEKLSVTTNCRFIFNNMLILEARHICSAILSWK